MIHYVIHKLQDNVNKEETGNTAVCMNGGLRQKSGTTLVVALTLLSEEGLGGGRPLKTPYRGDT